MNLDFYIKKKHLFKRRTFFKVITFQKTIFSHNYIYSPRKFRLEFVYVRFFKKIFRRRFMKAKTRFFKPKYWLMFLPNFILTQKSKNARMGAGVGKFLRLTSLVKPGKAFINTWYYNYSFLKTVASYLSYKLPNRLLLKKCYK